MPRVLSFLCLEDVLGRLEIISETVRRYLGELRSNYPLEIQKAQLAPSIDREKKLRRSSSHHPMPQHSWNSESDSVNSAWMMRTLRRTFSAILNAAMDQPKAQSQQYR
jgi:hypothetical protein